MVVERLERGISDHCPQLLCLGTTISRRVMFKFYNVLAEHLQFEQLIRENWGKTRSHNLLLDVWVKCQKLKDHLKQLNSQWFVKTSKKVAGIRQQLQLIQHRSNEHREEELMLEENKLLGSWKSGVTLRKRYGVRRPELIG